MGLEIASLRHEGVDLVEVVVQRGVVGGDGCSSRLLLQHALSNEVLSPDTGLQWKIYMSISLCLVEERKRSKYGS